MLKSIWYISCMLKFPACLILLFSLLLTCALKSQPAGHQSILDTFPLPADAHRHFVKLKTADAYFQSACSRMSDWPGDSVSTYICIREYQSAIRLDPRFWHAYRNLSRCFSKIKRDDLALSSIELAFKYCPDKAQAPELYDLRGKILFRQNEFARAAKEFQKLVDIGYSPLADRYYWLALSTFKNGQKQEAIDLIKKAKDVDFRGYDLGVFGL